MPKVFLAALAIGSLMLTPAYAGQKSKGPAAPHSSPQTTNAASTHGNSHTTTATTTTKAHGNPHAATSGGNTTTATPGTSATTGTGTSAGTGTPTVTPTTTALNPIAQKLQGKPLGARIEKMLPSTMTLNTASAGFRNQGQFIAAVHVSRNLGIPFADLRATMLGLPLPSAHTPTPGTPATIGTTTGTTAATSTTTSSPLSLGQAIQKLRPSANSTTEAARAQTQATADVSTISSTTTATNTTTKKKGR